MWSAYKNSWKILYICNSLDVVHLWKQNEWGLLSQNAPYKHYMDSKRMDIGFSIIKKNFGPNVIEVSV